MYSIPKDKYQIKFKNKITKAKKFYVFVIMVIGKQIIVMCHLSSVIFYKIIGSICG